MTTNREWLYSLDVADLADWFDAEHVETEERALDGDTDALERKSADLIHEYYKPMVSELQAKVDELQERLRIGWECECKLQAEREQYRKLFGMALDWAHEITMLETSIDEGMA